MIDEDMTSVPDEAARALSVLNKCLGGSLRAVYLHGSAVSGGLRPNSDVDLLAIVDRPLAPDIRRHLVAELMQISGPHPAEPGGPRSLEVLIFVQQDLVALTYPARCAFVYGEWLRADFEAGVVPEPHADPEFTLVLAQARLEARSLIDPAGVEILPTIPNKDVRRAIADALPALLGNLEGDERNVLLTLARMWFTLSTDRFAPKDMAADWAVSLLSADASSVLALARDAYRGQRRGEWQVQPAFVRQVAEELADRVRALL